MYSKRMNEEGQKYSFSTAVFYFTDKITLNLKCSALFACTLLCSCDLIMQV